MENKVIESFLVQEGIKFEIVEGDILKEKVDVIVNAANSYLSHGGGVARAIANAAGEELIKDGERIIKEKGPIPTGSAVMTVPGNLPFKGIIHAVGPRLGEGEEEEKLKKAIKSALKIASEKKFNSISFPAISSGIFAFPIDICSKAYVSAVLEFFKENKNSSIKIVRFVLVSREIIEALIKEAKNNFL